MHEAAVAQSLIEVILQEAEKRHAKPVRRQDQLRRAEQGQ